MLKLYSHEADSAAFVALADGEAASVSTLVAVEFFCALRAKELAGMLVRGGAAIAFARYERDVGEGLWAPVDASGQVRQEARRVAQVCAAGRVGFSVRALDALHLASALVNRADALVTADKRLAKAAAKLGMDVLPA